MHPTVVLPTGNCVGWLQVTFTGADPPAVVGVGTCTGTGPPVVELASTRVGQIIESSGVGAGLESSPQAAQITKSNATKCFRRTSPETGDVRSVI